MNRDEPREGATLVRPAKPAAISRERMFELSADHAPGGTTTAYPREWGSEGYETDYEAGLLTLYDPEKRFRGRGYDSSIEAVTDDNGKRGRYGSRGKAVYRNGRWEIEWLQPHATVLSCVVLDEDGFVEGDSTIGIDVIIVIAPVRSALLMKNAGPTVSNERLDWDGDTGAPMYLLWDDAVAEYHPLQMKCPATEP